jgi:phage terminase large subunit
LKKVDLSNFYDIINPCYYDFFEDRNRIRLLFGGAGSGKSFFAFQEMIYRIISEPGQNYMVIRKVSNTHRTSCFALTEQIISELNFYSLFKINKSDLSITCIHNDNMIIFKGLDNREKLKSVTAKNGPITSILIEESSEITQQDFDQLNVRLRGKAKVPFQITMLFNPISDTHWIKKEFFDLKSYQKKYNVTILKTTYLDNEFIDEEYKEVLEGYKDIDYEFYKVYCLGLWGSYGNIIFNNWQAMKCPYTEDQFDAIYNGQDYGFTHPSLIVKIGFKDGAMYTYNELCVFEKTNKEFIQINEEFDVLHKGESARGDSAEPDRIKEWVQHGYGVLPAVKGPGSVGRGIDFLKSQRWYIDPDTCPRTLQEVQVYHYKTDKNGVVNLKEDPVDIFDDAIKAHMYALEPLSKNRGKPGVLSGTVSDQKKGIIEIKKAERRQRKEVIKAQRKKKKEEIENFIKK